LSSINFLLTRFESAPDKVALVQQGSRLTFGELHQGVTKQIEWLKDSGVRCGDAVILLGDYSSRSVCIFLGLIELGCILIPLTPGVYDSLAKSLTEVAPTWHIDATIDEITIARIPATVTLPYLYSTLHASHAPGLVMFTSGSSGKPKAVVHDFSKLLEKFRTPRPAMITLNFLLFDHWGGLNTLLHALSNLCLVVFPDRRTPESICELIALHRIELLPATPSFLNLLLISGAHLRHDMSSLRIISYGAEPMPASTLAKMRKAFTNVELRQTYGMIELGVLRAKTRAVDSLWVKVGGEGYQLRVVDGILQIKAESAMLGYINAPSPFTSDGYLITGDLVEQDGEWLRILGRQSDIINVGGQKVYPAEVEAVILEQSIVIDAVVYGESHPLTGKIVCADVVLSVGADETLSRKEIVRWCRQYLQPYKVPMKVRFVFGSLQTQRLKRTRTQQALKSIENEKCA
jgi:acyl-coenzyme A synthetase/AMP-(fatty) acid ligase